MVEYLSQYVDRELLFFVILFSTATATSLITRYLADREMGPGGYDKLEDDESRKR